MFRFASFVFSLVLLALPAGAEDRDRITGVIGAQIEAFRDDDVTRAFGFASPRIRSLFGTPERFGEMVERGYPMVLRPNQVRYLELREVAGNLWQRVLITDQDARLHLLDYQVVGEGSDWKINAVQILKVPQGNA
ncbi:MULTISPECIES: DUF4864 domain-containing protein [Rhodobacterales]|jgi:hypothetical protein|uniref:DUF4864 domain-containing protein n=1 Tax=Rhodobacterales TaxID=204455 RepID=UPI00237FB87E|nr:DUF4864 domain-containing protein [Phaeobacter gallaeciensis]MDE4142745.1 DUF4864 domain-containing protein [Phaeobacter gallaeciensis]MDE4151190.1 DUF4864 domain-containing protein [Phaeobacter gallaeciensis]MDE4155420.1 DUF4864 domain-containing protein [Phaeobacter gallaeciensis]MDE4230811.1 DUF4864 domain-containing protein [Phaeobacter gallaeciensis]MDE4259887.1 DUF4864 domain-containing protein [Phaeobacter gallaeciensis]